MGLLVWPTGADDFVLEREQWTIVVRRNHQFKTGTTTGATRLGVSGIDSRYDELERLLKPARQAPADARLLKMERVPLTTGLPRYHLAGAAYSVRWHHNPRTAR